MRPRTIATAAAMTGGAVAALLTRQLLRRHRNRAAAKSFDGEEPIEAVLVYDGSFDIDDLDDLVDLTAREDAALIAQAEAVVEMDPILIVTTVEEVTDDGRDPDEPAHLDDDRAQAHSETWLEALQEYAIEYGPPPESVLVFEADRDAVADARDRPVADRGSAGPRGL